MSRVLVNGKEIVLSLAELTELDERCGKEKTTREDLLAKTMTRRARTGPETAEKEKVKK